MKIDWRAALRLIHQEVYAVLRTDARHDFDDFIQEAAIYVHKTSVNVDDGRPESEQRGYMRRAARSAALNKLKYDSRLLRAGSAVHVSLDLPADEGHAATERYARDDSTPEQELIARETQAELVALLEDAPLTDGERAAVMADILDDPRVAGDVPRGTRRSRVVRAREKLLEHQYDVDASVDLAGFLRTK